MTYLDEELNFVEQLYDVAVGRCGKPSLCVPKVSVEGHAKAFRPIIVGLKLPT